MKFLCVACDRPMQLKDAIGPDQGSVALVYSCGGCGHEFAMLTNPHETQVVSSLGVKIGAGGETASGESKCPFTGMLQEMATGTDDAAAGSASRETVLEPAHSATSGLRWTREAAERLEGIPEFVRPMAKSGIEKYAEDMGYGEVDEKVLNEARSRFGM